MLIVFDCAPLTTPAEAVLLEEPVAQVALRNLVFVRLRAVSIWLAVGWFNLQLAVPRRHIRVLPWIDVNGHSHRMFRQLGGS